MKRNFLGLKKHQKLIDDYDTQKRKHLEKLSTKMKKKRKHKKFGEGRKDA